MTHRRRNRKKAKESGFCSLSQTLSLIFTIPPPFIDKPNYLQTLIGSTNASDSLMRDPWVFCEIIRNWLMAKAKHITLVGFSYLISAIFWMRAVIKGNTERNRLQRKRAVHIFTSSIFGEPYHAVSNLWRKVYP